MKEMKEMKNYKVIAERTFLILEKQVVISLLKSWVLVGGIAVETIEGKSWYYQAMGRY